MSSCLNIPRSTTLETLERSRNLASIAALATGLKSTLSELRQLCLKALLVREEEAAKKTIVVHWEHYDEPNIQLLRSHVSHLAAMVQTLLTSGSLNEKRCALQAIAALDIHDSMEGLLDIAVDSGHALNCQAIECLMRMCTTWGAQARMGKDVPTVRSKMLERLSNRLALFHKHNNTKLVDAWLCLAHWDDALQRSLISDPRQEVYRPLMTRLQTCDLEPVLQLLAGYLARSTTPKNVMEIIVERELPAFALEIAKLNDNRVLPGTLKRLQQLPPLRCLSAMEEGFPKVNSELERRLYLMLAASSVDLIPVLRGAVRLSKVGTREARQTAAEMLRTCRRPELESLVPAIQAAEVGISGNPECLGSLTLQVAAWLQSPSHMLKKAARDFLRDFTVENLLGQVRHWPTQLCKAMAGIVVSVETDVTERIISELQCPAPRRRLAALQVTQLLDCADAVSQALMPLLDDPRLEVRVRTIDLLGALGHEALEQLIPQLLDDASTDIQDAANRAARRMKRAKHKQNR
jgi:hypothetical protein